jgi:DNA polymerase-3 subunit epsilon
MKEKTNFKSISDSFAAIDFETANEQRTSVCSVGIVIVKEGMIVDRLYHLIRPEPDYYSYWNTRIHGITAKDTDKAPVFPFIWKEVEKRIEGLPLIAHNKAFDESCLKAVFKTYCMDYPDYDFHCTLQAARKLFKNLPNHKLNTVAAYCGYPLDHHHHALADAEACAMIALFVNELKNQ